MITTTMVVDDDCVVQETVTQGALGDIIGGAAVARLLESCAHVYGRLLGLPSVPAAAEVARRCAIVLRRLSDVGACLPLHTDCEHDPDHTVSWCACVCVRACVRALLCCAVYCGFRCA